MLYIFLMIWPLYHYIITLFVSYYHFWLKVYFVWYAYDYICFLVAAICLEYHLSSLHFGRMFVFRAEVSLLEVAYSWILFFKISLWLLSVFWLVNSISLHLEWLLIVEDLKLPFVFWMFYISIVSFSCVSVCCFGLVVFGDVFLSFLSFSISCLCSCFVVTMRFV